MDVMKEVMKMLEFKKTHDVTSEKFSIAMKQFLIACEEEDRKGMEEHRDKAHVFLDVMLDTSFNMCQMQLMAKEEAVKSMLKGRRG